MNRIYHFFMILWHCHYGSFYVFNISCPLAAICSLQIQSQQTKETIETLVYVEVGTLDIIESKISQLPSNFLQIFPNLEFLTADSCGLEHIQPELFGRSSEIDGSRLQSLKMAANNIKIIENYSFEKCINLTNIDLANNSIGSIESEAFAGLINLDTLDLHNNNLKVLGESVFMDCPKLSELNLGSNQLTDAVCLNNLENMITLNLSYNENIKLVKSFGETFAENLRSLTLNGVKQSTAELFNFSSQFQNLETLRIENNGISKLNTYNIPYMMKLKHLAVCDNKLDDLPVAEIRNKFPHLTTIVIGNNQWECNHLEVMLGKLRIVGINPVTYQKKEKSQVDGFNCRTVAEIINSRETTTTTTTTTTPLFIITVVIGTFIGVIGVLLLLVYLKLRIMVTSVASTHKYDNDFWPDDNYSPLDHSATGLVCPYATNVNNVELNPIYQRTENSETENEGEHFYAEI